MISGTQNYPSKPLYNVCLPIPDPAQHSINTLQPESTNAKNIPHPQDRIDFYHAALFLPVISNWTKVIKACFLYLRSKITAKRVQK